MVCHLFQWFPSESLNEQRILFPDVPRRNRRACGGILRSWTLAHLSEPTLILTLGSGHAGEPGSFWLCHRTTQRALAKLLDLSPACFPSSEM